MYYYCWWSQIKFFPMVWCWRYRDRLPVTACLIKKIDLVPEYESLSVAALMPCFHHLFHDGRQSSQCQASLIPPRHHSAAQLHHDASGLPELTPVDQGPPMAVRDWN